jgi:hypothetical protein
MTKIFTKALKNISNKIKRWFSKSEIIGLLRDRQDYLRQPINEFTIQGYEIIQDFLDKNECDRLIRVTNRYLRDQSYSINKDSYLLCRKDLLQGKDLEVQHIINAQEVDDKLSQLFHSHIIEEMFERQTGEKFQLRSITIRVDNPDTESKRGFHTDGVTPPVYKAFIYLSNVDDYGDGPYTVIPGSHRHTFRKIINYLYSQTIIFLSISRDYTRKDDIKLFYSDRQSVSIFGKAGTLIISNQQLVHKGWHQHDKNKRYALICYLMPEKYYRGQALNIGRVVLPQKA